MHMCYERPGVVNALNGGVGYDKWDRGGGGGAGAGGGPWGRESRDTRDARDSRDRETRDARDTRESRESRDARESREARDRERDRDRERERQARAHQMSHAYAAETDASSLFPAPIRVTGNRDPVVRQIQIKLGDYSLAQTLLDDPSKSIGICAEPPSPAPCHPSRRESEFKKPAHAPQNGRIHHRPYYNRNESLSSSGTTAHRPPPLRIPNGVSQNAIDSSQSHIENILKEMKALPTPVSGIAATPRKELENKFVFNHFTNKVQENPRLTSSDLKTPPTKPALDNRISNSRSSPSPDVNKDLGLSESDDEVAATSTRLEPILSPLGSGGSPSSGSESSPSDSESESSSAESSGGAEATEPQPPPTTQRPSWCLSNFAPPAQPDLNNVLAVVAKERPSPISELSDSEASSPSPEARRRRPNRISVASSDEESSRPNPVRAQTSPPAAAAGGSASTGSKRGRPPKSRPSDEQPAKKKRGRPPKTRPLSPARPDSDVEAEPPPSQETKSRILGRVFVPKKPDECGGKGGKGGKGKGGKGKSKGQVTIIEVTAPESGAEDYDKSQRDRSVERRNEEALARVSPPQEPETLTRRREADRMAYERIQERKTTERPDRPDAADRAKADRTADRADRISDVRASERLPPDRLPDRLSGDRADRHSGDRAERKSNDRLSGDKTAIDRLPIEKMSIDRIPGDKLDMDKLSHERLSLAGLASDKTHERLSGDKSHERLSGEKSHDRLASDKYERAGDKLPQERLSIDRVPGDKLALDRDRLDRVEPKSYVCAEADVGFVQCPLQNSLSTASVGRSRTRLMVRVPLSQLRAETQRALRARRAAPPPPARSPCPPPHQVEAAATNHERSAAAGQTPIYYSYFERLPADTLSDEERDHKYYLEEAKRLRTRADAEQEPLSRVMLYLESVLCFVLTGRVLELELDTKRAFTIYRETIEYIKSIHSMPQRFRASPHSTFSKLDILSLRVQALLYLRMFKMYNREVKEYYKIVQEYQQKHNSQPACAESVSSVSSVSPLSPTPSPASVGSLGSLGSGSGSFGSGSASSGYCSLAHAVPAHAHHALLQLTKYYTFLYVAHDLWEQADCLCRLKPNQDLFIAVDRKCGPLTLFSTFRHLVQYVRHAISLLKNAQRE